MATISEPSRTLNAVCPYYTMFPLQFPLRVLSRAHPGDWVLDPYCGRGTSNFAARLLGLPSVGIDSSPVAAALAKAKLASATVSQVMATARYILRSVETECTPRSEFWRKLYHSDTLDEICQLRTGLLRDCESDSRILLRAIILGALHGPRTITEPSHLSNQCPRTFAPKPTYAVSFWKKRNLKPTYVDTLKVIRKRATRYLTDLPKKTKGSIILGDSRDAGIYSTRHRFDWVITSPPYYGMRTYIPDQWIRYWFLGGPSEVAYHNLNQLEHTGSETFVEQLASVWKNVGHVCNQGAKLVARFGAINDRRNDPLELIYQSLSMSGWRCITMKSAGNAGHGKRQARQFKRVRELAQNEYDVYASLG